MSFGSFLSGVYHQINPFDRGQTYGTYNPPQKKKRPDEDQPAFAPRPAPAPVSRQAQPAVQRPKNIFTDLNNDLKLPGSAPSNYAQVNQPQQQPQHQNFWHSLGHGIKTAGQTAAGVVSNLPEVGLAAARAGTGIVQGATQLPSLVTHAATYAPRKIAGDDSGINRALSSVNRGVDKVTEAVDRPFNYVNRGLDIAAKEYERKVPTAYGGKSAYRATQVPLNVLAALLTLGGSTAAEAGNVGKIGQVTRFFNKPLTSNSENLIARAGQTINRGAPIAHGVMTPVRTARKGVSRGVGRLKNDRIVPTAERGTVDAGEIGNVLSDIQLDELTAPTQIPVSTGVNINAPPSSPVRIPVTNNTPRGPIIRELSGDATRPGTMPTPEEITSRRFNNQPPSRPDQAIEGVTRRPAPKPFKIDDAELKSVQDGVVNDYAEFLKDLGEGNGVSLVPDGEAYGYGKKRVSDNIRFGDTKGKRMTKSDWIDEAERQLKSGKAEPGHQQVFDEAANADVQSLLAQGEQKAPPIGKPIVVKSVKGIPVTDQTVVPTEAGTPGTVRLTTQSSPTLAKSKEVAASTPPTPVPTVSPEVQAVLDNPKQFTKRQVTAARRQLRLAKQMAKIKANTKDVVDNMPELVPKPEGNPGFVPTGRYNVGARGNVTESASKTAEETQGVHDTANLSVKDVLTRAQNEAVENGAVSPQSVRNLKAMRDSGKFAKTSPEYKALNTEYNNAISHYARGLSLTDRAARGTASGDQLTNRFINKLLVFADSNKLTDQEIAAISRAENAFTEARDTATALGEQFKATGGEAEFKAWRDAHIKAEQLDRQAKITEFHVSKRVLGGNKSPDALRAMQQAEKEAGVYSMDTIDANMLSGTGTMVRNFINTLFPRAENRLFGRVSSLAVRKIAPIGGSSFRGARLGSKIGRQMFKADVAARKEGGVGFIRRNVTAGNTLGEQNIQSTAYARGYDHYKQLLKNDGYSGKELSNRAEFMARTDPEGLVKNYESQALQANALSSLTHSKKFENILADRTQKWLADSGFGKRGQQAGRLTAKGITRVGFGFPTVIARSMVEGLKRATLGLPEAGWSAIKFAKTGDKEAFANELAKSIQHAGSGGSLILLGHALGKAGVISGSYPSDPAERARWKAEGKQPNSINIGGQWFNIPGYLGGFALPLMFGASTDNIKDEFSLGNAWQTVLDASPVDNIQSTVEILTGNASDAKIKNAVTSLARTVTPAGSFVAEVAKLLDPTKNDTTTKDTLHNILDSIASGIPLVNNAVNKTPATDQYGNVIKNPNRIATVFGAQGSEQKQGTEAVNQEQNAADQTLNQLKEYGVIGDKNLMQLVDPKLAAQIQRGEPLTPEQISSVQKAVTKGVSATEDNNWREAGQYATDKAALQTKIQLLKADPTTKPSEIAQYEAQVKRDDVLQNHNIPYDALKLYEGTTLTEWRKMGDSQSDSYDPDTYQKLWNIDEAFTKAGVSYKTGDMSKQKYSAKTTAGGSGGRKRKIGTDFGKLEAGANAPSVQKYDTINTSPGAIPIINRVRPNIVHNISSSG